MTPGIVIATITVLLGLAPITTDLYLPALPTLQVELGADAAGAQLTLSLLIACFGIGQLVCGPLADRFGRRPLLLCGLGLFTVAAALAALAPTIEVLIAWRAVQGFALAAAVTCGRSIVRDLYGPREGGRVMSTALCGLGLVAMAGPAAGGLIAQSQGWRAALALPAVCGAFALAFIALKFEETLRTGDVRATRPVAVLGSWRALAAHPGFCAWTALLCVGWAGIFVILTGSPFVYIHLLGVSRVAYGLVLSATAAAYVLGTLTCRRLLWRHGLAGTVRRGAPAMLFSGAAMAALALAGVNSIWAMVLPQCAFAFGYGLVQPCAQVGVVAPFPQRAGTAASLSGFAMMTTAFFVGIGLAAAGATSAVPMALGVATAGTLLLVLAFTAVRAHGNGAYDAAAPVTGTPAM